MTEETAWRNGACPADYLHAPRVAQPVSCATQTQTICVAWIQHGEPANPHWLALLEKHGFVDRRFGFSDRGFVEHLIFDLYAVQRLP